MNRRSFLRSLGAAAAAPVLLALPAPAETVDALVLGERALEKRAVPAGFASLSQAQMRTWARSFWNQAKSPSYLSRFGDL